MLSILVEGWEKRDVATADVAGAYLKAKFDDFVVLRIEGASVDIMCRVNKEYEQYITYENGKKVMYLQLLKALYGCVKLSLLWYELFTGTLQGLGFKLKEYDLCVANKMINRKQCTMTWYVDDIKISHMDPGVVTETIRKIEERFGKMTVARGKSHVFLGIQIDYNAGGTPKRGDF
jgi:hypothetical protein